MTSDEHEPKHEPKHEDELSHVLEVVRGALRGLYRSRLPQMAAALAYRTIFGLIPILIVALVVLKMFSTPEDITALLDRTLEYTGLKEIELADEGPVDAETTEDGLESSETGIDDWIQSIVANVSSIKFQAIGAIGLITLLYAALSMLVEVERAFNQVYRAPSGRPWTRRLTQYWTMLTLGSLALFATFAVGEQFKSWVGGAAPGGQFVVAAIGFTTTTFISSLLLLFMYLSVPHATVRMRPALAGAVVAAVLWEAGKWGFTQYLHYSATYSRLYGSIALIPLFLLWVYVTWLIVLFGLQVSFGIQSYATWQEERDQPEGPTVVDHLVVVSVLSEVARCFNSGRLAGAGAVAERVGVSSALANQMLESLSGGGFVRRAEEKGEPAWTLARPAGDIRLADVVALAHSIAHAGKSSAVGHLREAERAALDGHTIESFLGDSITEGSG